MIVLIAASKVSTNLPASATSSQSMCDSWCLIITFMATLSPKGFGLPCSVDRALGLPEQFSRIHRSSMNAQQHKSEGIEFRRNLADFILEGYGYGEPLSAVSCTTSRVLSLCGVDSPEWPPYNSFRQQERMGRATWYNGCLIRSLY